MTYGDPKAHLVCVATPKTTSWSGTNVQLPRLGALPASAWRERHTAVLMSLLLLLPILVGLSVASATPVDLVTTYVLVIGLITVLAVSPKVPTPMRQMFGASAVLTATVALVEAAGRGFGAHLVFACSLVLLTLYRSWSVQLFATGYLVFYYFVLGSASPDLIFPEGTDRAVATRDAALLLTTAVLASVPGVVAWYLTARASSEAEALRLALARASLREQQAAELNDTVVQDLATALYAHEEQDEQAASAATRRALDAARTIVSSLISPELATEPGRLVREAPAQDVSNGKEEPRD